ncbi:Rieske 2Fe-2S domain-containing protein [Natronobacterium texcoconense]|uniref:Ferredoxin subunit of nitrite reductase or a ring-hydroxylating dioxygenase n=1 Tax=Natronobacterium texcoconense TaxID=1095778 RepID=A0A1H1IRR9_NATTX|nr:Rieske 2Fe-2S domain-containing protein [Natronobacterium texcoconense]SDR40290.1 Ferredoxin subunit of nitrite reductase or a ring-hydroxylating dioxygenase [Natronobacterium texcoconense]
MATSDEFRETVSLEGLEESGRELVALDGIPIVLFHHEGEIRAVNNRCPHMGFPLVEGTVEDGLLTCHWHHARFELACGDTFDPWADDLPTYPVEVRDGTVYVNPNPPRDLPPEEHWADRLETGLEENLRLVVAKATIGTLDAGVDYREPTAQALEFGTQFRESGWGPGLTILGCMANVIDDLEPRDRKRALYTGVRHVADDCAGQPPDFHQPSLSTEDVPFDRLKSWFRDCVELRDPDGAERCLRTAVAAGHSEAELAELVFAAATDHPYLSTGHVLDFANTAFETLEHVDSEHTADALASLVQPLVTADRSDERSSWRQPVDLVALLEDVYGGSVTETSGLEDLASEGKGKSWSPPAEFQETLLGDDPEAIVDALADAVREGATTEDLAAEVAAAATTRVAQFGTGNEFGDWNTVHHTFTYANAVHVSTRRTDAIELYRGVFDAALSVYLDRFLNTPPAPMPEPGDDTGREPDAIREDLLETFDAEGGVNEAARLVGEFFDCGGDPAALKRTLGHGLLREDAGFHTLQNLEAAFRQFDLVDEREDSEGVALEQRRRRPLIATARYMAAHFPTRREAEQTFSIATRLNRGETVHENGSGSGE